MSLALAGLYIMYALRSSGVYDDDVIGHYLIARWSWRHPELFLNTWGRPAFTILYAPVALFGLKAEQVFSAVLAALVCIGSARLAQSYGLRKSWLAALFTGLEPEFVRQGFAALTELVAAGCLCMALLGMAQRRWWLAALGAALLPFARYELLPVLLLFTAALTWERRWRYAGMTLLPLLAWNCYNAWAAGAWPLILFPFDRLFGQPGGIIFDYGSGPLAHYVALLPDAFGGACLVLAALGLLRLRMGLLHACVFVVIAVLSISYWAIPSTGIAGYIRHLAVLAPVGGVLAVAGVEQLAGQWTHPWRRWAAVAVLAALAGWLLSRHLYADVVVAVSAAAGLIFFASFQRFAAGLAAQALLVMLLTVLLTVRPYRINDEQQQAWEAGQWLQASAYHNRVVLGSHAWFTYGSDVDPYSRAVYRPIMPSEIDAAPVGSIIVWDSHYSARLVWQTPRALVQRDPRLRLLRQFRSKGFELDVYEKVTT
ncbi:MAG TPA: hypothetical protein VFT66_16295 [Roseiflexaceae bacterium]|nr:hypothetical protein [Roseiflexaceae bacterium]